MRSSVLRSMCQINERTELGNFVDVGKRRMTSHAGRKRGLVMALFPCAATELQKGVHDCACVD